MRLCPKHHGELRAALNLRGLERFIQQTPITGHDFHAITHGMKYEPFVRCQLAIVSCTETNYALKIADAKANGELCPICEALAQCTCGLGENGCAWAGLIDDTADIELRFARERGHLRAGAGGMMS